ncbi:oxidoreductase [Massilia niastensis]|uniref:oxidoreductase n=1 Tax=Massilia niastensis TaxID=544911 RepID=UPI00035EC5B2|nr:oxidoreductase [Massilia niastensis]
MAVVQMDSSKECPERAPGLKVGVVGFGYASATFHAPLIRATPGLCLAAVASSAPDRVRQAVPEAEIHATPTAMYERPDIDLVVIATPNDTHFPLAREALEAGKHVVVDKPFVLDAAQARELTALAERKSLRLSVFHNRRWDGDFLTVRDLIAEGRLGRVVHFESHFDRYRPVVRTRWRESAAAGAGLWYDLGPHLLDQALQLFGKPDAIWLDVAQQRDAALADDWFHAVLKYGGMRAILHASALTAQAAPRFTIHGTEGSYVKHGLDLQEAALLAGTVQGEGWADDPSEGLLTLRAGQGLIEARHPTCSGAYGRYYAEMRDAILLSRPVPVSAASACEVMDLIEAGTDSARCGKQIVLRG